LVTTAFVRFHFIDDVLAPDGTGAGSFVGMGDTDVYALVTPPMLVEGLLFGVGPFLILPAGDLRFGSVNVGVGPGAAVTWQGYGVSLTLTVLHAFSFVDDETDYSQTQLIPTVSYVFDTGTAIVAQSETVYEWHSDTWVAPLSIGVTQVFSPGPFLRMNIGILGKWWPASPTAGPDWGVRVLTTLLRPALADDEGGAAPRHGAIRCGPANPPSGPSCRRGRRARSGRPPAPEACSRPTRSRPRAAP